MAHRQEALVNVGATGSLGDSFKPLQTFALVAANRINAFGVGTAVMLNAQRTLVDVSTSPPLVAVKAVLASALERAGAIHTLHSETVATDRRSLAALVDINAFAVFETITLLADAVIGARPIDAFRMGSTHGSIGALVDVHAYVLVGLPSGVAFALPIAACGMGVTRWAVLCERFRLYRLEIESLNRDLSSGYSGRRCSGSSSCRSRAPCRRRRHCGLYGGGRLSRVEPIADHRRLTTAGGGSTERRLQRHDLDGNPLF